MMKVFKAISMVFLALAVTSAVQADLVAHWTFDEASGPALDSSGNGYDGTIVGTVVQGQAGQIGGAYQFSGSGWVDFGVDTVTTQVTNFPLTISYWVQGTSTSTECAVWMGRRGADSQYLQTGTKDGNALAVYRNTDWNNSLAWKDDGATGTEGDGEWHHIVAVYPSAEIRHVYVDGVLADSAEFHQSYFTGTDQIAVGNNNRRSSLTDPFDGLIDDVKVWDEALELGAIAAIYADGLGDVAADPLPLGNSVDPAVTTALSWSAPEEYIPEVGYNLVLRKATGDNEPNFAGTDNIVEITDATATSPFTVSLDYDATYYWRVDSFEPSGAAGDASDDILHPGVVWSFTTKPSVPVVTGEPSDAAAFAGDTAVITLEYTSLSSLTGAVWEQLPNGSETWIPANGTAFVDEGTTPNTVTLTIADVAVADEGLYRCTLTNDGGTTISDEPAELVLKRQLAHYAFEGNANDTNNGGGITNDGVASVNGTGTPDITYAPTGIAGLGDAVVFNAATLESDPNQSYIQLPMTAYPNADVGGGLESGTISCWVKPKAPGVIMGVFNEGLNTGFEYSVYNETNVRTYKRNELANQDWQTIGAEDLTDGETWFFVASTWGDADGKLRTYIARATENGHLEDIVDVIPDDYVAWQYAPTIGASNSRGEMNTFMKAGSMVDDLKVYNYAMTPEEIAGEFHAITGYTMCVEPDFIGNQQDINGDCVVDLADFADFAEAWLTTGLVVF